MRRLNTGVAALLATVLITTLLQMAGPAPAAAAPDLSPDRLVDAQECHDLTARMAELAAAGLTGVAGCLQRQDPATTALPDATTQNLPTCGTSSITARNGACYLETWVLTVFVVPTNQIVGEIVFQTWGTVHLNYNALTWSQSFNYRLVFVAGAPHPGVVDTQLVATPVCALDCVVSSGPLVAGSAMINHSATATYRTSPRPGIWNVLSAWRLVFTNPLWVREESDPVTTVATPARCDDTLGGGTTAGCVFPEVQPIHDIHLSRYRTYALHVRQALQHPGIPSLLTRTMNQAVINANRDRACPTGSQFPRPAGLTCDEYPFASTLEGAASQPYGAAPLLLDGRPFGLPAWNCRQASWLPLNGWPGPGGYSVCLIPAAQNSGGGNDLADFYYRSRVIDNERFAVRVVP